MRTDFPNTTHITRTRFTVNHNHWAATRKVSLLVLFKSNMIATLPWTRVQIRLLQMVWCSSFTGRNSGAGMFHHHDQSAKYEQQPALGEAFYYVFNPVSSFSPSMLFNNLLYCTTDMPIYASSFQSEREGMLMALCFTYIKAVHYQFPSLLLSCVQVRAWMWCRQWVDLCFVSPVRWEGRLFDAAERQRRTVRPALPYGPTALPAVLKET